MNYIKKYINIILIYKIYSIINLNVYNDLYNNFFK